MQIDCRNLECPQPVINTKNALNELKNGEILEILVNAVAPKENISRFLTSQNIKFTMTEDNDEVIIRAVKSGAEIKSENFDEFLCKTPSKVGKVVYINEEHAGSGAVGVGLMSKFIGALLQLETKPYAVICVNNAVKMTTDRGHVSFAPLKELERAGVKILSCGSCLEAYKLVDKLSIGEMTNAYEVVSLLDKYDVIKL
ncbi:sulfurtransferase-like selenium metabolism protein YedF [Campylobacter sp. CCUG 57310]|uniref:sulfurtransferase-like selenium metabolism protein YedF n=1 Tax=Campylobacter sp. CCUG 57310 TaxID=2517362 RepID=UPI0015673489|nr:sulfurtransferase-like selenium metabolism protein YedF [Campylobacter sp. CCUG 57310]QKF91500.1 selenium metabolism protein [Campylobacter sp. CCUG 57310]